MGKIKGVRLRQPLAYNQVNLGDITLDVNLPWNDCRPFPKVLSPEDVFCVGQHNLKSIQHEQVSANSQLQLKAFLRAYADATIEYSQTSMHNAPVAKCYRIRNSGDKFEESCGDKETRAWLQKNLIDRGRGPGYMVVGLYTFTNAQLGDSLREIQQVGGGAGLQVIDAAAQLAHHAFQQTVFTSPGEQIFAVEFRKIKLKWFRKVDLDRATLEPNVWEIFWGMEARGPLDEVDDENFVMAQLDEETDDGEYEESFFTEEVSIGN